MQQKEPDGALGPSDAESLPERHYFLRNAFVSAIDRQEIDFRANGLTAIVAAVPFEAGHAGLEPALEEHAHSAPAGVIDGAHHLLGVIEAKLRADAMEERIGAEFAELDSGAKGN